MISPAPSLLPIGVSGLLELCFTPILLDLTAKDQRERSASESAAWGCGIIADIQPVSLRSDGYWYGAADIAMIDRDPFTCDPYDLKGTRVVQTWVGGRLAFKA